MESNNTAKCFIERISAICEFKKISMRDIARGAGLGQNALTHIKVIGNVPKTETLIAISNYLNVSVSWLIGENERITENTRENERKYTEYMRKQEPLKEQENKAIEAALQYTRVKDRQGKG